MDCEATGKLMATQWYWRFTAQSSDNQSAQADATGTSEEMELTKLDICEASVLCL